MSRLSDQSRYFPCASSTLEWNKVGRIAESHESNGNLNSNINKKWNKIGVRSGGWHRKSRWTKGSNN